MSQIVTRFAPSPTGYLHIGGARTALFNWLFTRHYGGKFLLRIEDTDRARSTEAAVKAIFNGLNWLGIEFDGEPIFQFARMDRHAEVAHELIKRGKAYLDYTTPAELEELRKEHGEHTALGPILRKRAEAGAPSADAKPAVRIKAPAQQNSEMVIQDSVQGEVKVPYTQLDDMILLRSDGTPTYMLSVVVDDHDMGITHIIRGDDHLTNAFRQRMIYDAMEWSVPDFSHIPLIHGPDGAKLSKRHGALAVEAYADMGYLPEAMRNYLLRLGWGHGDTEIITSEDAMKIFELRDIGQSPSRMDFAKLANVNAHYLRAADDDRLMTLLVPFIEKELGSKPDEVGLQRLKHGLKDLKERAQTLIDLAKAGLFYLRQRPLPLTDDAAKVLDQPTRALIGEMKQALTALGDFKHEQIESALKEFSAKKDLKLGKVAMPLRAAITGTTNSPSVFHVAEILGKEETLARLSDVA
ncbi:MAG TPA: glutamate--tRNA ligase [Patescibacteria group bacterium]|nr:glutamate--tRNA ligase [Patescibacteria group bacterium]